MIINWGDAPFKAFITVTYPNGSCTVSLGDKSFTHSGGGTHTFTVTKKGTWTVTAVDGVLTGSASANVSNVGQTVSVNIVYRLALFENGADNTAVTGGWQYGGDSSTGYGQVTTEGIKVLSGYPSPQQMTTVNRIDMAHLDTAAFTFSSVSGSEDGYCRIALLDENQTAVLTQPLTRNISEQVLDVSSLSGAYYVMLSVSFGTSGHSASMCCTGIVLTS